MKKTVAYTLLLALILSTAACGSETSDQVTPPRAKQVPRLRPNRNISTTSKLT